MRDCAAVTLMPLAAVVLAAATTPSTLAIPAFSGGRPELASFCSERLADELGRAGFNVVSEKQMAALLGLERQKQLMGCTGDSSECIAELTNALGADVLVSGSIAQLGKKVVLDVRVFSSRTGVRLGAVHGEAAGEEQLPQVVSQLGDELVSLLGAGSVSTKRSGPGLAVWLPLGLGVVSGAFGGVMFWLGAQNREVLVGRSTLARPLTYDEGTRTAANEGLLQTAGWLLCGGAAVALVTALILWAVGQ